MSSRGSWSLGCACVLYVAPPCPRSASRRIGRPKPLMAALLVVLPVLAAGARAGLASLQQTDYSAASSSDDVLKHLLGAAHDLAETPNTDAPQHLFSTGEIPPAVQSASIRHNRVIE